MNSAKMKSLQNYKTMEEQLKTCLPLEVFLAQELVSQKSLLKFTPIVLTGLFSGGRSSEILAFATASPFRLQASVMRVGSDTFGDPIYQKGLQNQPSSPIISVLG